MSEQPPIKTNYQGNSDKAKMNASEPAPERQSKEKIITGAVIERKQPLGSKIKETFSGEAIESVADHVIFNVVIPATKNLIQDVVNQGIDRILFGGRGRVGNVSTTIRGGGGQYASTAYHKVASGMQPQTLVQKPDGFNSRQILLSNRGDAEMIVVKLQEDIAKFDVATVADLKDMLGKTPEWTDQKLGWTNLGSASVSLVNGGYLLNLPVPEQLQ